MNHPFQDSLINVEKRLENLTKLIAKNQSKYSDDLFIDNDEFQKVMQFRYYKKSELLEALKPLNK